MRVIIVQIGMAAAQWNSSSHTNTKVENPLPGQFASHTFLCTHFSSSNDGWLINVRLTLLPLFRIKFLHRKFLFGESKDGQMILTAPVASWLHSLCLLLVRHFECLTLIWSPDVVELWPGFFWSRDFKQGPETLKSPYEICAFFLSL